jgi:Putative DNA-binding domain
MFTRPLADVQTRVMRAIRWREHGDDVHELVASHDGIDAGSRLAIYRNHMHESLGAALAAVFPVVLRLVGEPFFRQAARLYVTTHPLRAGSLLNFGDTFPQFLGGWAPAAALPYLADVAALEWAYHRAYHAAEYAPLDFALLAEVPAERHAQLRLRLQPSARWLASRWPVLALWLANQPDAAPDALDRVRLDAGGDELIVVQRDLEIEFRRLSRGEGRWLRRLAADATFAEALADALDVDPDFDLGATLARHASQGLFTAAWLSPFAASHPGGPLS